MTRLPLAVVAVLGLCVGCEPEGPPSRDAGSKAADAAVPPVDAGSPDAGSIDAGKPDAGPADAGLPARAPFMLGFWCGPPVAETTAERYRQVAAAGFTFASPPCDEPLDVNTNRRILTHAHDAGLTAFITDPRLPHALAGVPDATARLDAIIRDYAGYPGLAGYHQVDEPSRVAFPGHGEVTAYLRQKDPTHPTYSNLLPNYATAGQLGTANYEEYVDQYATIARPAVLSYDHYNWLNAGERAEFFSNLATVRRVSQRRNIPFLQIVLGVAHLIYRAPSEGETRWEAMQTLAYGGVGVMYFTYWTPKDPDYAPAMIDRQGNPTPYYDVVKRVNVKVRAFGEVLAATTNLDVFQNGALTLAGEPRRAGAPVYIPSTAPLTVGVFGDAAGNRFALVTNRDFRNPVTTDLVLAVASGGARALDAATGAWSPVTGTRAGDTLKAQVTLAPGDGELFWMPGPVPSGPAGAEVQVGMVRNNAGDWYAVDSKLGAAAVRLSDAGWNTCGPGYKVVGRDFGPDGFWLCAREDLANRRFYVGNVVANVGFYFRVEGTSATRLGDQAWNTCTGGTLLGNHYASQGFWVCLE